MVIRHRRSAIWPLLATCLVNAETGQVPISDSISPVRRLIRQVDCLRVAGRLPRALSLASQARSDPNDWVRECEPFLKETFRNGSHSRTQSFGTERACEAKERAL